MKKIIATIGLVGAFMAGAIGASAAYFNNSPVVSCGNGITMTLRVGSQNSQVATLQDILANQGYLHSSPNGYFGQMTKQAVVAFQADNGISPTGVVGPATRQALNEHLCGSDTLSFNPNLYAQGVTYVSGNDPFVTVVNPPVQSPVVYEATHQPTVLPLQSVPSTVVASTPSYSPSQIAGSGIIYSPSVGYTYGITPMSGSITVTSPVANMSYVEGDTVIVNWGTNNLNVYSYTISLESSISGQSKVVGSTSGNAYSFVLTRDLLESVCSGACNNYQTGSYKVVVSTPTTDIAGNVSTLKAIISPLTIKRPLGNAQVTIGASKTPINSGEVFKLYVTVPQLPVYSSYPQSVVDPQSYSVRIKAICPSSVSVSVAGTMCGQEFIVPPFANTAQQEIPASIANGTWYRQEVVFQVTVVNLFGQVIGQAETRVIANPAPFNW